MLWNQLAEIAADLRAVGLRAAVLPGDPEAVLYVGHGSHATAYWFDSEKGLQHSAAVTLAEIDEVLGKYGPGPFDGDPDAPETQRVTLDAIEVKPTIAEPVS